MSEQQTSGGRIVGLHRYPVKGCGGEALSSVELDGDGIVGDRRFMIVDETLSVVSILRAPRLVLIQASLDGDVLRLCAPAAPELRIEAPAEGEAVTADLYGDPVPARLCSPIAAEWLTGFLQRPVRLVTAGPRFTRANFYRQDPNMFPPESNSYVNAAPLLVVGAASVEALARRAGQPIEMARFRPNIVVAGFEPHAEDGWSRLQAGQLGLEFMGLCERCAMTQVDPLTAQPGPEPMRTLKKERHRAGGRFSGVFFGAHYRPAAAGRLSLGDACVATASLG